MDVSVGHSLVYWIVMEFCLLSLHSDSKRSTASRDDIVSICTQLLMFLCINMFVLSFHLELGTVAYLLAPFGLISNS